MLIVARKNLFSERTRLFISVGGVALSVFLITFLLGLFRGWDEKVGSFVENSDVDVWVSSEGARDFMLAASLLPVEGAQAEQAKAFLDADPSVDAWSPLIVRRMEGVRVEKITGNGERLGARMDLHFVGFDTTTRLGGPIEVLEGKDTPGPGEVIVDKALGKRYGIKLNDVLRAGGRDWLVVGKSKGGDFVAAQTVFVTHEEAQQVLGMSRATTFYVLRLKPWVDAARYAEDIERLAPEIVAYTRDEFASNTRDRVLANLIPILIVILILAFVVGLAVAGLTMYTATVEKSREYGILKAVGFRNSYLYRLVFEQSIVTATLGFVVGLGLTLGLAPITGDFVPQFVVFIRWQDALVVFAATAVMAVIAAYVPVRRLAAIDPTSVFRA